MTAISNNDIARAIYLASKDSKHEEQPLFFKKVVQFLIKRKLLSKTPNILFCLSKIINDHEGRVVAKVSSSAMIDEKTKKELSHILIKRYSAKEVTLIEVLDEKLLGGLKVEVNDEVIDLTIKNKIKQLQEYLIKSI